MAIFSKFRNTHSTAGNSMSSSERPSPEPLLKKEPYWGGDNSGNALEASNALNYSVWGIPAVLSRGTFAGSFRNSCGKSQPYRGYGPKVHVCSGLEQTISGEDASVSGFPPSFRLWIFLEGILIGPYWLDCIYIALASGGQPAGVGSGPHKRFALHQETMKSKTISLPKYSSQN